MRSIGSKVKKGFFKPVKPAVVQRKSTAQKHPDIGLIVFDTEKKQEFKVIGVMQAVVPFKENIEGKRNLVFKRGVKVHLLSKDPNLIRTMGGDKGDWVGEVDGKVGVFPRYYAQEVQVN